MSIIVRDRPQACTHLFGFLSATYDHPPLPPPPQVTQLTTLDFLRYWYYGGNVYVGLKNFPKAIECYRLAIAAPATR